MTGPDHEQAAAIIPAAGLSTRFPGEAKKQFRRLGGKPLLLHTLERIWSAGEIQVAAVAVPAGDLALARDLLQPATPEGVAVLVVAGGVTRQDSVAAGLAALPEEIEIVVIHDAVRPLFEPRWIAETIALCRDFDGAIVAVPATDTLKEVAPDPASTGGGIIRRTVPRESVWRAQTPQAFRAAILRRALAHAVEADLTGTDEAALVEAVGGRVAVVQGSPYNIKVTTAEDWQYLEWRLAHG